MSFSSGKFPFVTYKSSPLFSQSSLELLLFGCWFSGVILLFLFISLLKPFTYKIHISVSLKINPWVLETSFFKLHWNYGVSFIYAFFHVLNDINFEGVSLLSLQTPFVPPSLHLSLFPSFSLLSFFFMTLIYLCIEFLLCAGHDTKILGISHFIKTIQHAQTHTPFLDLMCFLVNFLFYQFHRNQHRLSTVLTLLIIFSMKLLLSSILALTLS